jgi:DNA-binding response OmpR family regulator
MSSNLSIAVVEDHDFLRVSTVNLLRERGYRAEGYFCAEDLVEDNIIIQPDLYIIDLNLPGEDGLSLAKRIRAARSDVGIVMVTARGHIQDKVQGYASGADIYLPKPVDPDELLAVVDRFSHKVMQDKVVSGDAVFSYSKLLLEKDAQHVHLTQSEGNLLNAFLMAPSQILERWQVMEVMAVKGETISDASMEVRIGTLRKKLTSIGVTTPSIQSIRKLGYRLCLALISK